MKQALIGLLCILISILGFSQDYSISGIRLLFPPETPGFGPFQVQVTVRSLMDGESTVSLVCIYSGLTRPGVYFKDQPLISRAYLQVTLGAREEKTVVFERGFVALHPETLGEILVSIAGTGVVRSLPFRSRFHPGSEPSSPPAPGTVGETEGGPDPSRWEEPRLYHSPFEAAFGNRITLFESAPAPDGSTPVYSENRGYFFRVAPPDFTRSGPWTTSVYVYAEKRAWTRLTLSDHGSYPVQVRWINEKLLFVRVWWGRLIGTDLILDAESGAIVNREMVRDGRLLFRQHRESTTAPREEE